MKSVIIYTFAEVLKTNPPSFTGRRVVVVLPGNVDATEYRICTPAEIGNAVRRCAEEAFYKGKPGQMELEDLLRQRQQFTPAMERESEQMQAIRNLATYARPAIGGDRGLLMCIVSCLSNLRDL